MARYSILQDRSSDDGTVVCGSDIGDVVVIVHTIGRMSFEEYERKVEWVRDALNAHDERVGGPPRRVRLPSADSTWVERSTSTVAAEIVWRNEPEGSAVWEAEHVDPIASDHAQVWDH